MEQNHVKSHSTGRMLLTWAEPYTLSKMSQECLWSTQPCVENCHQTLRHSGPRPMQKGRERLRPRHAGWVQGNGILQTQEPRGCGNLHRVCTGSSQINAPRLGGGCWEEEVDKASQPQPRKLSATDVCLRRKESPFSPAESHWVW